MSIKCFIISCKCLITINHTSPGENRIFVTCDASDIGTGAVLFFRPMWEIVQPIAFELAQLNVTECNYSIYEKELLAIVRALYK